MKDILIVLSYLQKFLQKQKKKGISFDKLYYTKE